MPGSLKTGAICRRTLHLGPRTSYIVSTAGGDRERRSLVSLAYGMPQFTFACFCGLHGFCKMKRKKEEVRRERETAV
ncbi:bladder cancer associated transcript 1 isoform X1 [Elephas maximus indicus]|uniref:bladder cancer associated transcript 1 isoform X1 n=1 Tax=Elephas maximus indicus TaxID=99487 RepID=UPI002116AA78|nr:bladder cancer associated transcript 1 isoform X1 [Elephas maximus indicus]